MIFSMIEKERFEKVLEEGSKLFNTSKEDFQRIMETDFMATYVTGYYGHGVPMGNAAKAYFEEIETELFAELEDLLPMKPASEKIADDTLILREDEIRRKSMDVIYKVKAKVLIDIETEFTTVEGDPKPTADTIKLCVDEDIAEEKNILGAIPDCEVVEFEIVSSERKDVQ